MTGGFFTADEEREEGEEQASPEEASGTSTVAKDAHSRANKDFEKLRGLEGGTEGTGEGGSSVEFSKGVEVKGKDGDMSYV